MNRRLRSLFYCIACFAAWLFAIAAVRGESKTLCDLEQRFQISANGSCRVEIAVTYKRMDVYNNIKRANPNIMMILRDFGIDARGWNEIRDVDGEWKDMAKAIRYRYTCPAMARVNKDGLWELAVDEEADLKLVAVQDHAATVAGSLWTKSGSVNVSCKIQLPAGAGDVRLLKNPARLTYKLAPPSAGTTTRVSTRLDVQKQMMSSLAKSHANPKFNYMWVARFRLENAGDQTLNDYRVRFRIVDFTSAWSPWETAAFVAPGQTRIDAYFPILDSDKVQKLNGNSKVTVEAQFEYTTADGKRVVDTEAGRLDLLGRNNVYYSNVIEDEQIDWHDKFNLGPVILASFVTHDDPIIQQAAGWISGQAGGVAAGSNDDHAKKYLRTIYQFLRTNKIAYQTPPGTAVEGNIYQNVKYGRDVLQNRAGTCIDLAILWGSLCQAVGLDAVLVIVPGHCFPAVKLPQSGNYVAVEATMVGGDEYEKAVESGNKKLDECLNRGRTCKIVNIRELQDKGIRPIELPVLPVDTLAKWGIQRVAAVDFGPPPGNNAQPSTHPLTGGAWTVHDPKDGQAKLVFEFFSGGRMVSATKNDKGEVVTREGAYALSGNALTVKFGDKEFAGRVEWVNADHLTFVIGAERMTWKRVFPPSEKKKDPAPAPMFRITGTWSGTIRTQEGYSIGHQITYRADGTFVLIITLSSGDSYQCDGEYSYSNGRLYWNAGGRECAGQVTVINANKHLLDYAGQKVEFTRQRV